MDVFLVEEITDVSAIPEKEFKTIGMIGFYGLTHIDVPTFFIVPQNIVFRKISMNLKINCLK